MTCNRHNKADKNWTKVRNDLEGVAMLLVDRQLSQFMQRNELLHGKGY
jgi:hypothetical protein